MCVWGVTTPANGVWEERVEIDIAVYSLLGKSSLVSGSIVAWFQVAGT